MQRFKHHYEVLIQGEYLGNAQSQDVYRWLEANRASSRSAFSELFVGGGERLGHFVGPERARLPQVDGDEDVATPQNSIEFFPQ